VYQAFLNVRSHELTGIKVISSEKRGDMYCTSKSRTTAGCVFLSQRTVFNWYWGAGQPKSKETKNHVLLTLCQGWNVGWGGGEGY
jgi:hypothetical protein